MIRFIRNRATFSIISLIACSSSAFAVDWNCKTAHLGYTAKIVKVDTSASAGISMNTLQFTLYHHGKPVLTSPVSQEDYYPITYGAPTHYVPLESVADFSFAIQETTYPHHMAQFLGKVGDQKLLLKFDCKEVEAETD